MIQTADDLCFIAFELYEYGGRIGVHNDTASLFSYAFSNDGVLLAPALFAASVYMTLDESSAPFIVKSSL